MKKNRGNRQKRKEREKARRIANGTFFDPIIRPPLEVLDSISRGGVHSKGNKKKYNRKQSNKDWKKEVI